MLPNDYPPLPDCGRLIVPVSEGCCRVYNADIQIICVKIKPLFFGEAVLLFGLGGRHLGGVCNARREPIAFTEQNNSMPEAEKVQCCGLACAFWRLGAGAGFLPCSTSSRNRKPLGNRLPMLCNSKASVCGNVCSYLT